MNAATSSGLNRTVLLAVDDSENSRRAVDYAGAMLGGREGFQVTLLHVISEPEEDYFPKLEEKRQWLEQYRRRIAAALEGFRRSLVGAGVPEDGIRTHTPLRFCPSIAECILSELETSGYGTIVVGRQGLSRKEEFLFGSVSSKIVSHARNCTVWVVA
ncbi:MAG: universal stress protein [Desulfobacterales bacterium]|jgi:nucleotide-binding universal stress UspA family protein|nr:universal stress protein [Desulfobacterales bacterium]